MPSKALVVRRPGASGARDEYAGNQGSQASERPWDSDEFMERYHDQVGPDGRPIVYGVAYQGGVPPRVVVAVPVPPPVPNVPGCSEAYGVYYQNGAGGGSGGQKPEYRDEGSSSRHRHKWQSAAEKPRKQSKSGGGSSEREKKKKKEDKSGGSESAMAALRFFSGETDVLGRRMGHSKRK
ncbi:hypothetical protein MAPG_10445 [Magnaporthiopsis poae ATCC 64411]|uniref:Uncharacterized protein n=1 Tax=Magnaporthiopsis poae (strain ATCC 64411 / 73-15) TaxID=644358 RepID=A0A0C4ECL6_MAGP6|nr:hypothetical protein MAPG_10445 [Magnaporthiopsis poae ATCC 64411]